MYCSFQTHSAVTHGRSLAADTNRDTIFGLKVCIKRNIPGNDVIWVRVRMTNQV